MAPKIHDMVDSCGKCPSCSYYSGGMSKCAKTDQIVRDKEKVADFCPLPDFPSEKLARMAITISALQGEFKNSPVMALFGAISSKYKWILSTNGAVVMRVRKPKDGQPEEIHMGFHDIIEYDIQQSRITFLYIGLKHIFEFSGNEPYLRVRVIDDRLEKDKEYFENVDLV